MKSVTAYSHDITKHSISSWNGIDFNLTEPQIIKSYLLDKGVGVDYLNRNLAPILRSATYEVKFASVFIHQKPRIVRIATEIAKCEGDTLACELGDLLVVFCLLDKNKVPLYRSAAISQAKKTRVLTSQSQQCLYDSDMKFNMPERVYRNSVIQTPERNLPSYAEGRTKALHYLILDKYPIQRRVPWDTNIEDNWTYFIHRMLIGDLGLPFEDVNPAIPDWNCIMHDLLNIGQGIIPGSIDRGNTVADIAGQFNDFNEYEKYSLEVEDAQGLPMLFIIVRDTQNEKK